MSFINPLCGRFQSWTASGRRSLTRTISKRCGAMYLLFPYPRTVALNFLLHSNLIQLQHTRNFIYISCQHIHDKSSWCHYDLIIFLICMCVGDCDWLLWQLYRQACRADPSDPEGVVTEMQCACDQMRTTYRAAAPGTQNNPTALSASSMQWLLHFHIPFHAYIPMCIIH